ncbi:oxidative stress-responsive serine-rich protein 1-like [Physella acuta]|uniref:oxidative stress-responsive serine-rich protein 1-like n=1 Tax=Physella acuta TaxID=109671 RepID=UPI0027DC5434|nr:oxidative stress-responsive serine-rich protein 1-like [Physella acuta]XP_059139854.1 oxidative stress-responsive serine-rich protein 1-like [Physella acuta]
MGDPNNPKPLLKPGKDKGVFDVAITKLLKDFTSAELLTQEAEPSSSDDNKNSKFDHVISSMKCLHLRKPKLARYQRQCVVRKKGLSNTLNLAVAANSVQRPIVWPARLSSQDRKSSSAVLYPPRLDIAGTKSALTCTHQTKLAEKSLTNKEPKSEQKIFGSCQSSLLSFTSLSESRAEKCQEKGDNSPAGASSKLLTKRHTTGPLPPAKHARTSCNRTDTSPQRFSGYRSSSSSSTATSSQNFSGYRSSSPGTTATSSQNFSGYRSSSPGTTAAPDGLESLSALSAQLTAIQSSQPDGAFSRSCSQEMRMEETNVNKLASYLEDFLHIPRKMSSMAEMMYA